MSKKKKNDNEDVPVGHFMAGELIEVIQRALYGPWKRKGKKDDGEEKEKKD